MDRQLANPIFRRLYTAFSGQLSLYIPVHGQTEMGLLEVEMHLDAFLGQDPSFYKRKLVIVLYGN